MIRVRRIRALRPRWVWCLGLAALAAGLAAAVLALAPFTRPRTRLEGIPTAKVRRTILEGEVLASGHVASSNSTEIRCTLEQLKGPGPGQGQGQGQGQDQGQGGGTSTILSLIPDGSTVKEGDVLCELDASEYEEELTRQKILVEQAKAEHQQAALTLDVARIGLESYRAGEVLQAEQQFRGQIALARSELTRQADHMVWSKRMLAKGYSSAAQVSSDEQALRRMTFNLTQLDTAFRNYQRFSAPKDILFLQSQVVGAEATFKFQSIRLKSEEERLAHYQGLVDRCTVRAPHDGFVIYANRPGRALSVYPGAPVRERLRLFYLPDLSKMAVGVLLHETVVDRVREGMTARVRMEALPGRTLEGRLTSVSQLPLTDKKSETGSEVTYFLGQVELPTLPEGLRPGMSAEVAIAVGQRNEVLGVPPAAVMVEDGQDICYVARQDHLERRPVKVGQGTPGLLEVTEGLGEDEDVVLDPSSLGPALPRLSGGDSE
jgi:HlyD family secretion protein